MWDTTPRSKGTQKVSEDLFNTSWWQYYTTIRERRKTEEKLGQIFQPALPWFYD